MIHSHLDRENYEISYPASNPIRRVEKRSAQPPSMENDEAREPSVPNCSKPKELLNADATCKEVVDAREEDECEGGRREGRPLQEKSGSA